MRILAIETSCDETGVSIVEAKGGLKNPQFKILANITASQILLHNKYGGVFPMMAKREHAKNLTPILEKVLKGAKIFQEVRVESQEIRVKKIQKILEREPELAEALIPLLQKIKKTNIDAIAVTSGPGLEPTLWVGINFAKALSLAWNIPVIPVNHMEGHIFSALLLAPKKYASRKRKVASEKSETVYYKLASLRFPLIALLISGGHTELVLMKDWFKYKIVGETRDDAVGEAFDKVARMLGLPYPGGPEISRLAKLGGKTSKYKLPRPMLHSKDFNFSFSGLKTAVLYTLKKIPKLTDKIKADIAREFEESATEVLTVKTLSAMEKYKAKTLILGGGVSANNRIRESISKEVAEKFPKSKLYLPPKSLTGDNALMIAAAGYLRSLKKTRLSPGKLKAEGNLRLGA